MTCDSNEIDHSLAVTQTLEYAAKIRIVVSDHNRFRMLENRIDTVDHQPGYVRNAIEDEIPIGTNETGQVHILIENAQVVAFSDESFDYFDHRTFAQIVGARLETESQDTYSFVLIFQDELQSPVNLEFIARQDRSHDGQV